MTDEEYNAFKDAVAKQRKDIAKKQAAVDKQIAKKQAIVDEQRAVLKQMLQSCPHTELERKTAYYEGDYYNKAYTDVWNVCTVCGERSEVHRETHSYYG